MFFEDLTTAHMDSIFEKKEVAIDTELSGLHPGRDHILLMQIYSGDKDVWFFRSKDWKKSKNLIRIFTDNSIRKIFHFALADCSFILRDFRIEVNNPYCTKIASKIARTYSSQHNLSVLLKEFIDIKIDKSFQSTYWGHPELSDEQLSYAKNDVLWLFKIRDKLEDILIKKGELDTGITYTELNKRAQNAIPLLVQLWINGWDVGQDNATSIFSK